MNTTYKSQISPYQIMGRRVPTTQDKNHPVQEEIRKNIGSYNLAVEFSEDSQTLQMFPNLPNLIAFTCRIKKDGEVIGFGHGASVLNKVNRFIDRTVRATIGASLVDAVVRSKMLDALHFSSERNTGTALGEAYKVIETGGPEPITSRQKSYLLELAQTNISDKYERDQFEAQIDGMSKDDASEAIQVFVK